MQRKHCLATGHIYHIFNRSIANYTIFPSPRHFSRFIEMLSYYQFDNLPGKFSKINAKLAFSEKIREIGLTQKRRIDVLAYCLMPNHFHLILKQNEKNGISNFMQNLQNSYSHFFNIRHNRQGPLWAGKFKNVLCASDEQLLHLSRYIHLNPVTAQLVDSPEKWEASSYPEYVSPQNINPLICRFKEHINISSDNYRTFVINHIDEQRSLAKIKKLLLD